MVASSTCSASSMGSTPRRLLGVCAVLMAIAVANAASVEVASVVIGQAKCADCTRKNMKAEAAFKGLKVTIKCKDGNNGEYTSKAVSEVESSGAFSVPVSVDLHGADCLAQLHTAAGTPCPGQEPSRITPLANGSFVAIPGNNVQVQQPSAVCASVTICGPIIKRFFDHFHKKPVPPKPQQPGPKPPTDGGSPAPSAGSPTPGTHHHFFDHFHKKPVPPQPKPVPKPQPAGAAAPSVSPTPIYHPPAKH